MGERRGVLWFTAEVAVEAPAEGGLRRRREAAVPFTDGVRAVADAAQLVRDGAHAEGDPAAGCAEAFVVHVDVEREAAGEECRA